MYIYHDVTTVVECHSVKGSGSRQSGVLLQCNATYTEDDQQKCYRHICLSALSNQPVPGQFNYKICRIRGCWPNFIFQSKIIYKADSVFVCRGPSSPRVQMSVLTGDERSLSLCHCVRLCHIPICWGFTITISCLPWLQHRSDKLISAIFQDYTAQLSAN